MSHPSAAYSPSFPPSTRTRTRTSPASPSHAQHSPRRPTPIPTPTPTPRTQPNYQPHKRHPLSISTVPSPPTPPSRQHQRQRPGRSDIDVDIEGASRVVCSPCTPGRAARSSCSGAGAGTGAPSAPRTPTSSSTGTGTGTGLGMALALLGVISISPSNPISRTSLPSFSPHAYSCAGSGSGSSTDTRTKRGGVVAYNVDSARVSLSLATAQAMHCGTAGSRAGLESGPETEPELKLKLKLPASKGSTIGAGALRQRNNSPLQLNGRLGHATGTGTASHSYELLPSPSRGLDKSPIILGPSLSSDTLSRSPTGKGVGAHHSLFELDYALGLDLEHDHEYDHGRKHNLAPAPAPADFTSPEIDPSRLHPHSAYKHSRAHSSGSYAYARAHIHTPRFRARARAIRRGVSLALWVVLGMFIGAVVLSQQGGRGARGAVVDVGFDVGELYEPGRVVHAETDADAEAGGARARARGKWRVDGGEMSGYEDTGAGSSADVRGHARAQGVRWGEEAFDAVGFSEMDVGQGMGRVWSVNRK